MGLEFSRKHMNITPSLLPPVGLHINSIDSKPYHVLATHTHFLKLATILTWSKRYVNLSGYPKIYAFPCANLLNTSRLRYTKRLLLD